jgi:hypothetical protein
MLVTEKEEKLFMKKKIKIISALLMCLFVLSACQTGTATTAISENVTSEGAVVTVDAEPVPINLSNVYKRSIDYVSIKDHVEAAQEKDFKEYAIELSGLEVGAIELLMAECDEVGIDPFVILGLMRLESEFDTYCVGNLGERGLGQLMANTAEPVARNMGIEYVPDKLFEPEYNIKLFMTQFKYLYEFYDRNMHMTLTAYNRGQGGLDKYMASRSKHADPAVSDYSMVVLKYTTSFKEEFDNQ